MPRHAAAPQPSGFETFHVRRGPTCSVSTVQRIRHHAHSARLPLILPTGVLPAPDGSGRARTLGPPQVVAVYSTDLLSAALHEGIGATVLPRAVAQSLKNHEKLAVVALEPALAMPISVCIPDSTGLSDAAFAVHELVVASLAKLLAD